jgi:hypothetical protein
MHKWLKRMRGAVGMGLTWAVGWAISGLLIGVSSLLVPGLPWSGFFEVFDAPLPALAVPGLFAGVFFSAVLGVAGRRRRFSDLSLPRFAAWGALGGLLLTLFPFALVVAGLASREGSSVGTGQILAVITPLFVLLSAASASVTLLIARAAEGRASREVGDDGSDVGPTEGEEHGLLEAGSVARGGDRAPALGQPARQTPTNDRNAF